MSKVSQTGYKKKINKNEIKLPIGSTRAGHMGKLRDKETPQKTCCSPEVIIIN